MTALVVILLIVVCLAGLIYYIKVNRPDMYTSYEGKMMMYVDKAKAKLHLS